MKNKIVIVFMILKLVIELYKECFGFFDESVELVNMFWYFYRKKNRNKSFYVFMYIMLFMCVVLCVLYFYRWKEKWYL